MDDFTKHFNYTAEKYDAPDLSGEKTWHSVDGEIKISDMTNDHLRNTIHLILDSVRDYENKVFFNDEFGKKNKRVEEVCPYYNDLIEEADKRDLIILDRHTYGNSSACVNLVDLIEKSEYPLRYARKIGSTLSDFNSVLNEISESKNKKLKKYLLRIVQEDFKARVNNLLVIPDVFRSYLLNIISTKTKLFRKEHDL